MDQTTIELASGIIINSQSFSYEIIRVLGVGGFGITYLAKKMWVEGDIECSEICAIKEHFIKELCSRDSSTSQVIFSDPVTNTVQNSLKAFKKEATRLQNLSISHRNIVEIYEVFEANNTAYFSMEYLGSSSLDCYVKTRGKLSEEEATKLMLPIIQAVAELHKAHVTHYDIKPANIMLTDDNQRTVLIDFGLSKHYDNKDEATSTLAISGLSKGYAPIEQYSGITSFSPESDVYALGATLYFLLTGNTPPEPFRIKQGEIRKSLSHCSTHLADVVDQAMTVSCAHRFKNAEVMLNAFESKNQADEATNIITSTDRNSSLKKIMWGIVIVIVIGISSAFCIKSCYDKTHIPLVDSTGVNDSDSITQTDSAESQIQPQEDARTSFDNLDLCVRKNGEYYYFSSFEWNAMSDSEKSEYSKVGLVVKADGEEFLLGLEPSVEMTWDDAQTKYANLLPTYAQGVVINRLSDEIGKAIDSYGVEMNWQDFNRYWTREEGPEKNGWQRTAYYIPMDKESGLIEESKDNDLIRVRTVSNIPH